MQTKPCILLQGMTDSVDGVPEILPSNLSKRVAAQPLEAAAGSAVVVKKVSKTN